jgi:hypothetical protein
MTDGSRGTTYPSVATFARTASGNDYRAIEQRERGPPAAWNAVKPH